MKGAAAFLTYAADPVPGELDRALGLATLAASALTAGVLEGLVTLPLPFLRLGLANVFVLAALWRWGFRAALTVAAVKVFAAAVILGTLLSPVFPLNAGGALASLIGMTAVAWLVRKRPGGVVPASALGGAMHAGWQVAYLYFLTGARSAAYLAPPLAGWGLAAGIIVGLITVKFLKLGNVKG